MDLLKEIIKLGNMYKFLSFDIASLKNSPFLVYIKDKRGIYIVANDSLAKFTGFNQHSEMLNATDYDLCWSVYADGYRKNDNMVIKTQNHHVNVETILDHHKKPYMATTLKSVAKISNKIIGNAGFTIIQDPYSHLNNNLEQLTKREYDCLFHFVRGKSAQKIADIFNLSRRTVETHLTNIKDKLNCKNKAELIEKALNTGITNFIF